MVASELQNKTQADEFIKEKDIRYPVIFGSDEIQFLSNVVGGIIGVPATYFYDENGKLDKKFLGITPKNQILEEIKNLKRY